MLENFGGLMPAYIDAGFMPRYHIENPKRVFQKEYSYVFPGKEEIEHYNFPDVFKDRVMKLPTHKIFEELPIMKLRDSVEDLNQKYKRLENHTPFKNKEVM